MTERFSKKALTEHIQKRLDVLQRHWGFDPGNGTAQIRGIGQHRKQTNPLLGGAGYEEHQIAAAEAYGEFRSLLDMATHFELEVGATPEGYVQQRVMGGLLRYVPEERRKWGT